MNADLLQHLMRDAGAPALAVEAFLDHYAQLAAGVTGLMPEAEVQPVEALPDAEALDPALAALGREALPRAVILKLNGGLGTSMGLAGPKSLLPVKEGRSFLELTAAQARAAGVPLLLMNSEHTRAASLALLDRLPPLPGDLPRDLLQHAVPKVDALTLGPVSWPDERLRWCPPGHGDLYTALVTRGVLQRLLDAGYRTMFVSNVDNLGATLDPLLLGYMVSEGLPFLMEAADRQPVDRKGGHLVWRGGRLALREAAQCPPEDAPAFQDITRHRYFNTNNVWLDLPALDAALRQGGGTLRLPLIRNRKPVDPRDPASPPVFQLESAMGAAIERFEGARALRVPRARFSPVKTCADLLRVRSDATALTADGRVLPRVDPPPEIVLDARWYSMIDQLDARFPHGPPSLVGCRRLVVEGDWTFGRGVVVTGEVRLADAGGPRAVADGARLDG